MHTYSIREAVDEADLGEIVAKAESHSSRIRLALGGVSWKAKAITRLLRSYVDGSYRDVPWKTVAALSGAIVYFVSPADAIPDLIPGIGFADDALVIATVASAFAFDISRFLTWEREKGA